MALIGGQDVLAGDPAPRLEVDNRRVRRQVQPLTQVSLSQTPLPAKLAQLDPEAAGLLPWTRSRSTGSPFGSYSYLN
jgi:hypothetical protein